MKFSLKHRIFGRRAQHISRDLIQQRLRRSDVEDDTDSSVAESDLSRVERWLLADKRRRSSIEGLPGCRAWLQELCEEEQARSEWAPEYGRDSTTICSERKESRETDGDWSDCSELTTISALDATVLQRIHEGRGPRDMAFEDLLAPFRAVHPPPQPVVEYLDETYDNMKDILQAWNQRISGVSRNDREAKAMLQEAFERRVLLSKGTDCGPAKQQALDDASREMLHALTILRPEVARFETQEYFDVLLIMWANVCIAVPDMDEALKLLTMRILTHKLDAKFHANNAEKFSGFRRSISVARLQGDFARVERLDRASQDLERKIRKQVIERIIDKIKRARERLYQTKLKEIQDLTVLQAAQKRAAHAKSAKSYFWHRQRRACDQEDSKMQELLLQQIPDLDAHVHVAQSNAHLLADLSVSLFSPSVEDGSEVKEESTYPEFARFDLTDYFIGSVADILCVREEAAKMLTRMGTIESYVDMLLDSAKSQYREYDGLMQLIDTVESSGSNDGVLEVEPADK